MCENLGILSQQTFLPQVFASGDSLKQHIFRGLVAKYISGHFSEHFQDLEDICRIGLRQQWINPLTLGTHVSH